jgi:thiamine kinase
VTHPPQLGPKLASGRTAEVFAWVDGQILKLYQDWVPAADADHEAAVTAAVHARGLAAPRCFGRVDVAGRPGVIFERVTGTPLLDMLLREPSHAVETAHVLGRLHASLHACRAAELSPLRRRLEDHIQHAVLLPRRWQLAALGRLHALPVGERLCHGDFHPANILQTESGSVIIDWLDATQGNPVADVARTVMLLRYAAAPDKAGEITPSLREALVQAYLSAYRAIRPAPQAELDQWLPVIVAARLAEGALPEQAVLLSVLESAFGPSDG